MWMKNGERCYARWLLKDHASRRKRVAHNCSRLYSRHQTARVCSPPIHPRVSSETPSWCALTAVAPIVRFKAFAIFAAPTFFLASDFNSRTSDEVQARLTIFFLANFDSFLLIGFYS